MQWEIVLKDTAGRVEDGQADRQPRIELTSVIKETCGQMEVLDLFLTFCYLGLNALELIENRLWTDINFNGEYLWAV